MRGLGPGLRGVRDRVKASRACCPHPGSTACAPARGAPYIDSVHKLGQILKLDRGIALIIRLSNLVFTLRFYIYFSAEQIFGRSLAFLGQFKVLRSLDS